LRPIAIAISAGSQFFQSYSSGVLTKCGTTLDHGVNLVGLVQNSVDNYWIVKNSWGVGWGEKGYVRIARNSATGPNLCLVCSYPMYSSLV
jgi:C1A family cysteine protease